MDHHPAGPSRLGIIAKCMGSFMLMQKAEKEGIDLNRFSEDAKGGNKLHALLPASASLDELPDDDRDAVRAMRGYIYRHIENAPKNHVYMHEWRMKLKLCQSAISFGTSDFILLPDGNGGTEPVVVIDAKMGRDDQPPEGVLEWQLKAYGAMACQEFKRKKAKVFAFYPRTGKERYGEVYDAELAAREIAGVIERGRENPDKFQAGEHCKWCSASGICKTFEEYTTVELVRSAPKTEVSVEVLSKWLHLAKLIDPKLKQIKAACNAVCDDQGDDAIPGFVRGKVSYKGYSVNAGVKRQFRKAKA